MGRDKALLEVDGRSLIERAVEALSPLAHRTLLATGESVRYADLGLEPVLDRVPRGGPLAGLEAGLSAASGADYVVALACDMPRVRASDLELLLARAEERGDDVVLFGAGELIEPLCAVYRARCLAPVREALERGERRMNSFWGLSCVDAGRERTLRVAELPIEASTSADRTFVNVNTVAELHELEAGTGGIG